MSAHYIIAIDVGIKNLSLCIFDVRLAKIVLWDCVSIVAFGKYLPSRNVSYVKDFIDKYRPYFDAAVKVLIERQMRLNMRIIEAVLHAMCYDICTVIAPRSVKVHYQLSANNYRDNKMRATEWALTYVFNHPETFTDRSADLFVNSKKQDDFADSLLLMLYYLDTYSDVLVHGSYGDKRWGT